MPQTTNVIVPESYNWTSVGDKVSPLVIQHFAGWQILGMAFSDEAPSPSVTGHALLSGEKESGIVGSQLWVRSPSGSITVILTE